MILSILGGLFQGWLCGKSKTVTIWLFGIEAAAAALVALLLIAGLLPGHIWLGPGLLWYSTYCMTLYFHWDRRRTLKEKEAWTPSPSGRAVAILCFVGLAFLGAGLAYWSYGEEIRVTVIGLIIFGIAILELDAIRRRGWPRLGM
jgi:hypothetical protein